MHLYVLNFVFYILEKKEYLKEKKERDESNWRQIIELGEINTELETWDTVDNIERKKGFRKRKILLIIFTIC